MGDLSLDVFLNVAYLLDYLEPLNTLNFEKSP